MKHLACIMDGNRRWAKKIGKTFKFGYGEGGKKTIERVIEFCLGRNIRYLSLYAFSIENFKRPKNEQEYIFSRLAKDGEKIADEFFEKGVSIKFVGDRTLFPASVVEACEKIESRTKSAELLDLNILFCYGSQQEIVSATKKIVRKIISGAMTEDEISTATLRECFWTNGSPDPDMIIRTGGTQRLSNFLLYQAAYSEFYFLDCMWPEVTNEHLEKAFMAFENCKRNIGA